MTIDALQKRLAALSSAKRALVETLVSKRVERATPGEKRAPDDRAPLTPNQLALWYLSRLEPDGFSLNSTFAIRISGSLDRKALDDALTEIIRRHEPLRSVFPIDDGLPRQEARHEWPLQIEAEKIVLSGDVERLAKEFAKRPFNLEGGPVFRFKLLNLNADENILLCVVHHIAIDGWSKTIFSGELRALYGAFLERKPSPLDELKAGYYDYARDATRTLAGKAAAKKVGRWVEKLHDHAASLTAVPPDLPRPSLKAANGALATFVIDGALAEKLRETSARLGATLYMTLLSAFFILMHRRAGDVDMTIGTPFAGRTRLETEGLIGYFANTLPIRVDLARDPSFEDIVARVKTAVLDALDDQDAPLVHIVEALGLSGRSTAAPLFQTIFQLRNMPTAAPLSNDVAMEDEIIDFGISRFNLVLEAVEEAQGLRCTLTYDVDLYSVETIGRMTEEYRAILNAVASEPGLKLSGFSAKPAVQPGEKLDRPAPPSPEPAPAGKTTPAKAQRTELEGRLVKIWEETMNIKPIGVMDDFFDLGGHSLMAVQLFARMEKELGVKLPLALFYKTPTIEALASNIARNDRAGDWRPLVTVRADGDKPPLFCVHPGGGNVLCYSNLGRAMDQRRPLYGLQAVGLDDKSAPQKTIAEMADLYIEEMRSVRKSGPYHLAGLCMGALVAFEMARKLRASGEKVGLVAAFDLWLAPELDSWMEKDPAAPNALKYYWNGVLFQLKRGQLAKAVLRRLSADSKRLMRKLNLAAIESEGILRVVEALLDARRSYVPGVYDGKLTYFMTSGNSVNPAWRRLAARGVEKMPLPGDHAGLLHEPYVKDLAKLLSKALDDADHD